MIEFFSISTLSFISIISLGKIINYNSRFNYFIALVLLTAISFICLVNKINFLLTLIKIILVIYFLFLLIKKKIKIENFDYFYFIAFIFLLYFNFDDFFFKSDVINGYGFQIKVIFYNSKLPNLDTITYYNKYDLDFLQSIYFNYFISGSLNFREDVIILSQNIFLITCFATILKMIDLKNSDKIKNIIKLVAIFYLLASIFLQNGKNIFSEDFSILFIFGLTIFLIENIKKINVKSFLFLIICFFLLGLGKESALFLMLFPIGIVIFNNNSNKNKIINIICFTSVLLLGINFSYNLDSELQKKVNFNNELEEFYSKEFFNFNNKNLKIPATHFKIKPRDKYYSLNLSDKFSKLENYYQKSYLRYAAYNTDKIFFMEKLNKIVKENITDIEIYKASFLPPVRYIINKFNINFEFPRISMILHYWILFIFILYLFIFLNSKNFLNKKNVFYKYFFLILILIFANIILVFEDVLSHSEIIDLDNNQYGFKLNPPARDTSRYLGWSLIFSILFSLYLSIRIIGSKFSNYINIILITLLIIAPTRSYGYLVKIDQGKERAQNLEKKYDEFSDKFRNFCDQKFVIPIFDNDIKKNSFEYFKYNFHDYKFIQFFVDNNDKTILQLLSNNKFDFCLIVNDNLSLKLMIDKNLNNKNLKITPSNPKSLDYTVYLLDKKN